MPQSVTDKIQFVGLTTSPDGPGVLLEATVPPAEQTLAREILHRLHIAVPTCGWTLEIQDAQVKIWSSLHPTYGYQNHIHSLGKGLSRVPFIAREIVERIQGGCQIM